LRAGTSISRNVIKWELIAKLKEFMSNEPKPLITNLTNAHSDKKTWIDIRDSLPKVNWTCLLCTKAGIISTGYLSERLKRVMFTVHDPDIEDTDEVIGWQQLPKEMEYIETEFQKIP
jgi:hypothetical protein